MRLQMPDALPGEWLPRHCSGPPALLCCCLHLHIGSSRLLLVLWQQLARLWLPLTTASFTCSDGDPAVCRGCANETFPDPAAGGACVACRVAGCTLCQQDDANRCEDSGIFCINGTHVSNVTGTCLPCQATGCWSCTNDAPDRCDSCAAGFYREQATGECKPCADPACEACDVSQGAACDRCLEGHYLDSSTRICKPVRGSCIFPCWTGVSKGHSLAPSFVGYMTDG